MFWFFCYLVLFNLQSTQQASSYLAEDIDEYPVYAYYSIKYFVIFPILDSLHDLFLLMPLLPDGETLQYYDFYGNFCGDERVLREEEVKCIKMRNYTETFKAFVDNLTHASTCLIDDDPERIFQSPQARFHQFEFTKINRKVPIRAVNIVNFSYEEQEKSSDKWEREYRNGGFKDYGFDGPVSVQDMPKTFSAFPYLDVPLRKRFAVVLETYVVDLIKTWYPFIKRSELDSIEDLQALVLFHLYLNIANQRLNRIYTWSVIEDLRVMGSVLRLPKEIESLNTLEGLRVLFEDVLKFNLVFTFHLFLHSKILNVSSSTLIKAVLYSSQVELIKIFLCAADRNSELTDIGAYYDGKLCHAVYWNPQDWLFRELLKYKDVDWDAADCRGYTVLGYMVNEEGGFNERYRLFLTSTRHFNVCFSDDWFERNILDECLLIRNPRVGLSRFVTYLNDRRNSDDFASLLVSAALHKRIDYFDRILEYRLIDSCHELDSAFQMILQYTGLDEPYLYFYAARILEVMKEKHGMKGRNLEHLFFMKWEIQLARWRAAADEVDLLIIENY